MSKRFGFKWLLNQVEEFSRTRYVQYIWYYNRTYTFQRTYQMHDSKLYLCKVFLVACRYGKFLTVQTDEIRLNYRDKLGQNIIELQQRYCNM